MPRFVNEFPVSSTEIDYTQMLEAVGYNPEEPYPVYMFGADQKTFWSNFNPNPLYDKPYEIDEDGNIVHLPDPDLATSTNP